MTSTPDAKLFPTTRLQPSFPADAGKSDAALPEPTNTGFPPIQSSEGEWERWFAWYPVRLYMTSRFAWLKTIYRRCVTKADMETCDYTDAPDEFPS
jgi:hypothetical protein